MNEANDVHVKGDLAVVRNHQTVLVSTSCRLEVFIGPVCICRLISSLITDEGSSERTLTSYRVNGED